MKEGGEGKEDVLAGPLLLLGARPGVGWGEEGLWCVFMCL